MMQKDIKIHRLNRVESSIFELARPYLQVRNNEIHTRNAIEFAFRLLSIYKAEREIVIPAIILHDTGWSNVSEEITGKACRARPDKELLRIHEEGSLEIASNILKKIGFNPTGSARILEIIDGHDTREKAFSLNDQIVQDADKLTRYGESFWFLTGRFPVTPKEFAISLEPFIDQWFFLPDSREMARTELAIRRMEIENRNA